MIIRSSPAHLFLIQQTDHAALAARIIAAWRDGGFPAAPRRDVILLAIRRHDDGWIDRDRSPIVDAATGELLDYVHAPDEVRRAIWPDGVQRLGGEPYAAALVAQHALHLFDKYRDEPDWQPFFAAMTDARDSRIARLAPLTAADVQADYFFLRMADLLSLQFCDDWRDAQRHGAYTSRWDGRRLVVSPDPFGGCELRLEVSARQLPNRRYEDAADAARAWSTAPSVMLGGVLSGGRSVTTAAR